MIIPQGEFITGTLFLKSNVTLCLEKGAHLLGSTDLKDYPKKQLISAFGEIHGRINL